jgi:hypothetical protein
MQRIVSQQTHRSHVIFLRLQKSRTVPVPSRAKIKRAEVAKSHRSEPIILFLLTSLHKPRRRRARTHHVHTPSPRAAPLPTHLLLPHAHLDFEETTHPPVLFRDRLHSDPTPPIGNNRRYSPYSLCAVRRKRWETMGVLCCGGERGDGGECRCCRRVAGEGVADHE